MPELVLVPVLAQADHPVADQLTFFFHLSICSVVVAAGLVFFSWELLEVVSVPLVWLNRQHVFSRPHLVSFEYRRYQAFQLRRVYGFEEH